MAARLLDEFRTLSRVMAASQDEISAVIQDVGGRVAHMLSYARLVIGESLRQEIRVSPVCVDDRNFQNYLIAHLGHRDEECSLAIFLDTRGHFIGDEIVAFGSHNAISQDTHALFRRVIKRGSHGLILAHNHPSGQPTPSEADIRATRKMIGMAAPLGIHFADHLIVTAGAVYSMRKAQVL